MAIGISSSGADIALAVGRQSGNNQVTGSNQAQRTNKTEANNAAASNDTQSKSGPAYILDVTQEALEESNQAVAEGDENEGRVELKELNPGQADAIEKRQASRRAKGEAAARVKQIQEQLEELRKLAILNPKAAAKRAAELARQLKQAVKDYVAAGGNSADFAGVGGGASVGGGVAAAAAGDGAGDGAGGAEGAVAGVSGTNAAGESAVDADAGSQAATADSVSTDTTQAETVARDIQNADAEGLGDGADSENADVDGLAFGRNIFKGLNNDGLRLVEQKENNEFKLSVGAAVAIIKDLLAKGEAAEEREEELEAARNGDDKDIKAGRKELEEAEKLLQKIGSDGTIDTSGIDVSGIETADIATPSVTPVNVTV